MPAPGITWRERAFAAEARGEYTAADHAAWRRMHTCCVGEQAAGLADALGVSFMAAYNALDSLGLQMSLCRVLSNGVAPGRLHALLDGIEDQAHDLKMRGTLERTAPFTPTLEA